MKAVEYKRIANFLYIPLFEMEELDVVEYKFFLREAFIYNCSKTEEGLEYLRNAKRLEETDRQEKAY